MQAKGAPEKKCLILALKANVKPDAILHACHWFE
jgi:hypothetical protein